MRMKKKLKILNDCSGMFAEEIIETIFESRGVKDPEHFLNPIEEDMLPLDALYRVSDAAQIVIDGIVNRKKFFILYDTDLDGCASGAIITRYLQSMKVKIDWTINRGKIHGCNDNVVKAISKSKPDIVIIVDSLDATTEYYEKISQLGCDLIILDHHDISPELESEYDKYAVLVSSNRKYANSSLSGSGVCFKFVKYLDSLLGTVEADNYYDLAAAGILADVMNVDEEHKENRYIVSKGLDNLNNPLMKKIVGNYQFDSQAVLFSIAPLINSANRFDANQDAAMGLLADDNKDVLKHLKVLKGCKERQTEEIAELLPDLIEQAECQKDNKLLFCVVETDSGISGLLATKLCDMYKKQAIVVKETNTGYMGSLRGFGVDLRALCEATCCGEFNGHPQAAGVSIPYYKYDEFREKIESALSDVELSQEVEVDIELEIGDISKELVEKIKAMCRISGNGFKPIRGLIRVDNYEASTMSQGKHLVVSPNSWFKFIKWNSGESMLEEMEDHAMFADELAFVGTFDMGFLGRDFSIRMIVDDIITD